MRSPYLFSLFLLASQANALADTPNVSDTVPLADAIKAVKAAIDEYQNHLAGPLPPLVSAEFDFKTVTQVTTGGSFTFLIFKVGGSHEKDVTNDVTFTYTLPKPHKTGTLDATKPIPTLQDALARTIQSAALAVKNQTSVGPLAFSKLAVNIQYGVKNDGSGSATDTISLVTITLNADVNKNTIQSVKLTFGE